MIGKDLLEVGIPYVVEVPDDPLYADFHALRHTFLTLLGRNRVDLRTSQELAGHSSPLPTARYSHRAGKTGRSRRLPKMFVLGLTKLRTVRGIAGQVLSGTMGRKHPIIKRHNPWFPRGLVSVSRL